MGQVQSSGDFAFDPDEWEKEPATGQYRPRRRSADGRPFVRPRTPLQFGTVPTALPVNPADYVNTTVKRRAVDIDDWDAKLGTEEYSAPEHANVVGVDPREEAQMADQRYEEFLDKVFSKRANRRGAGDVPGESSRSIRHVETGDSSAAKPNLQPNSVQAESAIYRTSKKHRLERSSSENISSKESPKVESPPATSASYETLLDKAFPKRRAQMQQRHQRQQQQLQKLPDPPKPPAYKNPNIKPGNIRRSASTTLLADSKKRSASVDSPVTSLGSQITPSRSKTVQTKRCECRKCSGNPQSTELHNPPQLTGNTPTVPAMSLTNPGPGRITVDMRLRVHMDLPSSSSPTVNVMSTPPIQHQTSSPFITPTHPNYPRENHSQGNTRYTPGYASHGPHQYYSASQPPSRVAHTSSSPICPTVYYSSNQLHQTPDYYAPSSSHHHQLEQMQPYLIPHPPNRSQEQRLPLSPLHRSQTTPDIRLYHSQRQQSYLEMEQQRAAYARAHLSQLRVLQTQPQAQGNIFALNPGGYSISPSPSTPVPPFAENPFSRGTAPSMEAGNVEEEEYYEEDEEEEDDDDDDPYHDKRYGV